MITTHISKFFIMKFRSIGCVSLLFFSLALSLRSIHLNAGSCCAASSQSALIHRGPTKMMMSLDLRKQVFQADKNNHQLSFRSPSQYEELDFQSLNVTYKVSEVFQAGASGGLVTKSRGIEESRRSFQSAQDINLFASYKLIKELSLHQRPSDLFLYSRIKIPVSPGLFNGERSDFLDVNNDGHQHFALGINSRWRWSNLHTTLIDTQFILRQGRSFNSVTQTNDTFLHALNIMHVLNVSSLNLSFGLNSLYSDNIVTESMGSSKRSSFLAGMIMSLQKPLSTQLSMSLNYRNELILSDFSHRSPLGESLSLSLLQFL